MRDVTQETGAKNHEFAPNPDTHEQHAFDLSPMKIERVALNVDDYSCAGMKSIIAVERKSLEDLVVCVGHHIVKLTDSKGADVLVARSTLSRLSSKRFPLRHYHLVAGAVSCFSIVSGQPPYFHCFVLASKTDRVHLNIRGGDVRRNTHLQAMRTQV